MRWRGRERSDNVEDRRGMSPKMAMGGGGGLMVVAIVIIMKLMGATNEQQQGVVNVVETLQNARNSAPTQSGGEGKDDDHREFIEVTLKLTETVWSNLFRQVPGVDYRKPSLVIFDSTQRTGCGAGEVAMGPFYCPADEKIYVPPSFFDDLAKRHKSPGDFAQAYVIAHEVAHHVQNVLRLNERLGKARQSGDKTLINRESVRLELQADYLAGVWAHHAERAEKILEDGDMEEAIQAANQIGDDTLQRQATGTVIPERFTHGRSDQRVYWFKRGLTTGKLEDCNLLFETAYDRL